jgi:hypothetical protein
MDARWLLVRDADSPRVWPFDSREAAVAWADEHGLIGYHAEPLKAHDEHEAVCASCREPWPCHHEQLDREARKIIWRAEHTCARCNREIGGSRIKVPAAGELGEDLFFHGRQGACRNEAKRRLHAMESDAARRELERVLRDDEIAEQHREWRRRRKVA